MALAALGSAGALADAATEAQLKALKGKIEQINAQIAKDLRRRDDGLAELKRVDLAIQAADGRLKTLAADTERSRARLADLKDRERAQTAALAANKSRLADQVRVAFASGGREQIQLLLNQQDPAQVGRMSVYYRLFAERRARAIERVVEQLEALRETVAAVARENDALAELLARARSERDALTKTRAERQAVVARIDNALRDSNGQVAALKREQSRLEGLIQELQDILRDFPVAPRDAFPKLKGRLAWPLKGPLLADFGQPRAGAGVRWNGVLVAADRGAAVRAIARGRVAYADWLPGLGLLTVVEHSDGYISLYGYNETLAREVGEWVNAGDVVATAGDSGGQPRTALYFEIRRGRKALNPHSWFKSSVASR